MQSGHQFLHRILPAFKDVLLDAGTDMIPQQFLAETIQGGVGGSYLHQNIDAICRVLSRCMARPKRSISSSTKPKRCMPVSSFICIG